MRRELEAMGMSPLDIEGLLGGGGDDGNEDDLMDDFERQERAEEQAPLLSLPAEPEDDLEGEFEYEYDDEYDEEDNEFEQESNRLGEDSIKEGLWKDDNVKTPDGAVDTVENDGQWWKDPFAGFSDQEAQEEEKDIESRTKQSVGFDIFEEEEEKEELVLKGEEGGELLSEHSTALVGNDFEQDEAEAAQLDDPTLEDEYEYEDETYDEMEVEEIATPAVAENSPGDSSSKSTPVTATTVAKTSTSLPVSILPSKHSNLVQRVKEIAAPVPALLFPKAVQSFMASPFSVQFLITVTTGNFALRYWQNRRNVTKKQTSFSGGDTIELDEDIDFDFDEEDDYVPTGFGRPRPISTPSKAKQKAKERLSASPAMFSPSTKSNNMIGGILQRGKEVSRMPSSSEGLRKVFAMGGKRRNFKKETEELLKHVEELSERVEIAESTREQSIHDNDNSVRQLRESRKELEELTRTNAFLKSQLRDNKRILERAVNAERQKTNAELARVRDSMVAILERERRIMRTNLMKNSAEVRSMIAREERSFRDEMGEEEYVDEEA